MNDRVSFRLRGCVAAFALLLFASLLLSSPGHAQVAPAASHGSGVVAQDDSDAPDPVHPGWSATVATTASHDSLSGWSLQETPSLGYRLNRTLSFDASLPVYGYVNAVRTGKKGNPLLAGHEGVLGDAALASHFVFRPDICDYLGTLSLSAPTGDEHLGAGTGHLGYNVNNHFERSAGVLTPDFEAGIGNTSSLVRRKAAKSYTSSGELVFLQAGTTVELPVSFAMDAEAYEQLPIGQQTVYSRADRKHGAVLNQPSDAEDNGVTLEVDAPSLRRLLVSATLSHSIRLEDTTEAVSLTFLLHVPGQH